MTNRKLNVLLITQNFPPESVGGAIHNFDVAEYLSKLGCGVHVLTSHPTYPYGEFKRQKKLHMEEKIGNVKVTRLWTFQPTKPNPPPIERFLQYLIFLIHAFLRLAWMLRSSKKRNIMLITSHPPEPTLLVGYLGKKIFRIPWITEFRDLWLESAVSLGFVSEEGVFYRLSEKLRQLAISNADLLVYTTKSIGDSFAVKYRPKVKQILNPNGIIPERCPISKCKDRNLIYLGNLSSAYNLENLVRSLLHVEDKSLRLLLVGGGDKKLELMTLTRELNLEKMVEFVGNVPHNQALNLTSKCLLGLHSLMRIDQNKAPISIKILEYMGCGIPFVVANAKGELEELANASGAGLVVEDAPEEIAKAINKLVSDDELRSKMGENGRRYVEKEYNKPKIISELYREIIAVA